MFLHCRRYVTWFPRLKIADKFRRLSDGSADVHVARTHLHDGKGSSSKAFKCWALQIFDWSPGVGGHEGRSENWFVYLSIMSRSIYYACLRGFPDELLIALGHVHWFSKWSWTFSDKKVEEFEILILVFKKDFDRTIFIYTNFTNLSLKYLAKRTN